MPKQLRLSTPRVTESTMMDTFCLINVNGTKVYGPPKDWTGPQPSSSCELYAYNIPQNMCEYQLLHLFQRFGQIYSFRVPLHYGIRGYAFVRYTCERDAACAMQVLNHFFIQREKTLDVVNICEKYCLFFSNIPKNIKMEEIEKKLKTIFPSMERIYSKRSKRTRVQRNSGHVFVHFPTYREALEAKKYKILHLWGHDVNVVWAYTPMETEFVFNQTLCIQNIDPQLINSDLECAMENYVHPSMIQKTWIKPPNAYIDFTCREAAATILKQMQGTVLGSSQIVIEWAKPTAETTDHRLRHIDFDAVLRLKCIANYWQIPVVIFGSFFEKPNLQYAAVLLRNTECNLRFIIVTLRCKELVDIHSRLCEILVLLIKKIGGFPDYNYVLSAEENIAHLVGVVVTSPKITFIPSHGIPTKFSLDICEIMELSRSCVFLSRESEDTLLQNYRKSFTVNNVYTYLPGWSFGDRLFATILPSYRNKVPLPYDLNNSQITLALCYRATGGNFLKYHRPTQVATFACEHKGLPYINLELNPLSLTQSIFETSHVINHVLYGGMPFCHPFQLMFNPPLWIYASSYNECLKQVSHAHPSSD